MSGVRVWSRQSRRLRGLDHVGAEPVAARFRQSFVRIQNRPTHQSARSVTGAKYRRRQRTVTNLVHFSFLHNISVSAYRHPVDAAITSKGLAPRALGGPPPSPAWFQFFLRTNLPRMGTEAERSQASGPLASDRVAICDPGVCSSVPVRLRHRQVVSSSPSAALRGLEIQSIRLRRNGRSVCRLGMGFGLSPSCSRSV